MYPPSRCRRQPRGEDPRDRLQFRLWQIGVAGATVLICSWFASFGPMVAVVAILVGKHILVALLMAGRMETGQADVVIVDLSEPPLYRGEDPVTEP